jgi:hypothetical protein
MRECEARRERARKKEKSSLGRVNVGPEHNPYFRLEEENRKV